MEDQLVRYFIEETNKHLDRYDERFDQIDQQLQMIKAFNSRIIGIVTGISMLVSVLFCVLELILRK